MSYSGAHTTRKHDRTSPPSSFAMAIPRSHQLVPPPLPPPQYIPELNAGSDPGWQWANDPTASDYGRPAAVKPGSSLLGGLCRPSSQERHRKSGSSLSPKMLRDVHMTDDGHDRLQSERKLEHTTFQGSSQAYDKQLLSRIGGPSTPRKQSLPNSPAVHYEPERRNSQLSTNDRTLPGMGGVSPGRQKTEHRRTGSAQIEEQGIFSQDDIPMDTISRSPNSSDLNQRAGIKRRASSPPYDNQERDEHFSPRRQDTARFPNVSLSSASSVSARGSASLVSSVGMASNTSCATSYASGMLSPSLELDSKAYPVRVQPRVESKSPRAIKTQTQGPFLCECCPKKPKKFDTEEDLRTHESEKQYVCAYCSNRFKNKNEAERHQNSLHLRRHSWSCAALDTPQSAFHSSSSGSGDVCGFCGQEYANPPNWMERQQHLTQAHKFGQCNLAKKFFRADHFRQHLKHSHDGTSGKWTNMLESACMKDEPPPPTKMANMNDAQPVHFVVGTADMADHEPER